MCKLLIVESYGQIPYALSIVTKNYRLYPVTIVFPGFNDLFKLFHVLNDNVFHKKVDLLYFEPYKPKWAKGRGISRVFNILPDIIKERRYLKATFDTYLSQLEGTEVFFFSRGFNGVKYYLLNKLSRKNRLVYVAPKGPPYMSQYAPRTITDLAKLIIWKLTYGRDVTLGRLPFEKGFLYVGDRFIDRKADRVIDEAEADEMIKSFDLSQFRVFDIGDYSVIYFDEDLVGVGYVPNENIWRQELTSVFNILRKYFPEKEIAVKYYPGYSVDRTLIKGATNILPSFIPAELLYGDGRRLYVAVFSRSIANMQDGMAVSLANLISFKNDQIRHVLTEELKVVSKSRIFFPKSLDEFEQILGDFKRIT